VIVSPVFAGIPRAYPLLTGYSPHVFGTHFAQLRADIASTRL
jgi:hypothetical protein